MNRYLEEDLNYLSGYIKKNFSTDSIFLITGGTGYIGSLIVKSLQKAKISKIFVVIRDIEKAKKIYDNLNGIEFVIQDLTENIHIQENVDYIIHTASPTSSKFFIEKPVETIDSIVLGTKNILNFVFRNKIKSMVYLSSMEVFGSVDSNAPCGERDIGYIDIQNVRSSYSESKRLSELMCNSYVKEFGVNVSIARLSQIFGAGIFEWDNRVFKQFATSVLNGEDIVLHTKGDSYGNYTYSADAVEAILLLLLKGEAGHTYNVVNERNTMTIKEMAELVVATVPDKKLKVVVDIPKENLGYAPKTKLRLSADKIKRLGWFPRYGLIEMFERMMDGLKTDMQHIV